jgi:hypothetical protein
MQYPNRYYTYTNSAHMFVHTMVSCLQTQQLYARKGERKVALQLFKQVIYFLTLTFLAFCNILF